MGRSGGSKGSGTGKCERKSLGQLRDIQEKSHEKKKWSRVSGLVRATFHNGSSASAPCPATAWSRAGLG